MKHLILFLAVLVCGCSPIPPPHAYEYIVIINNTEIKYDSVSVIENNSVNQGIELDYYKKYSGYEYNANRVEHYATITLSNSAEEVVADTTLHLDPFNQSGFIRFIECALQSDSTFIVTKRISVSPDV